jgi:hypothetical protein
MSRSASSPPIPERIRVTPGTPGSLASGSPTCRPGTGRAARLNNHQRWFVNERPGLEIEQKFTLAGRPDISLLAARTRDLVAAEAIDGWIPEHDSNGGFGQWDFPSHIYEIADPEPERGYIAFIPAGDGSGGIRRKWFTSDAVIRREELTGARGLGPGLTDRDLPSRPPGGVPGGLRSPAPAVARHRRGGQHGIPGARAGSSCQWGIHRITVVQRRPRRSGSRCRCRRMSERRSLPGDERG